MFSIFRQTPAPQSARLRDLSEDQLSAVAGGKKHHHHHRHHHPMPKGTTPPAMTPPAMTPPAMTPPPAKTPTTTVNGVTYPDNAHW